MNPTQIPDQSQNGQTLGDLIDGAQDQRAQRSLTLGDFAAMALGERPSPVERIGRGMSDLYEPIVSAYLRLTDPNGQKQYDAQREADVAQYLRGLLGNTAIPEQLRGAVPDLWRGVGQNVPFFALGPMGGLRSLSSAGVTSAAAQTLGGTAALQPLMHAPELWDYPNAPESWQK